MFYVTVTLRNVVTVVTVFTSGNVIVLTRILPSKLPSKTSLTYSKYKDGII